MNIMDEDAKADSYKKGEEKQGMDRITTFWIPCRNHENFNDKEKFWRGTRFLS